MSEPIVFISHQRVKEGKLDGYKQYYREVAEMTERNKPGTLAHLAYVNDDGTEISIFHIFPDTEAMALHMRGVDELAQKAFDFVDIVRIEIYGRPSDILLDNMRQITGSGIEFQLMSKNIGGYMRLRSE